MGRHSTPKLLAAALLAASVVMGVQDAATAGTMTFLSPRPVAVRHNGGSLTRGGIKSMSNEEVVVSTPNMGDKSIAMSAVTSVIASDGSFKYYPAQETFDEFLVKSASMRGVTIVRDSTPGGAASAADTKSIATVSDGYARAVGMQPSATPRAGSSSAGFVQSGGFAGASQRPQGLVRLEAPTIPELDAQAVEQFKQEKQAADQSLSSGGFALPGGGVTPITPQKSQGGFALPAAGEEVLICSNPNCRKEVPGAKYGQKCPHCGIIWARETQADAVAANPPSASGNSTPVADPKNPFVKAPAPPAPAPAALPPVAAPGVPPGAAAAAQPQGLTLETIPWWGKILGFGASIMVLMWVLGRR